MSHTQKKRQCYWAGEIWVTCRCLSARHLVTEPASGHHKEMGINYECASYTTKPWLVFIQEEKCRTWDGSTERQRLSRPMVGWVRHRGNTLRSCLAYGFNHRWCQRWLGAKADERSQERVAEARLEGCLKCFFWGGESPNFVQDTLCRMPKPVVEPALFPPFLGPDSALRAGKPAMKIFGLCSACVGSCGPAWA